jgi:hypothetical protein
MKPNEVASLVSEAIGLERQIEGLATRLGTIRALLINEAAILLREEADVFDLRGNSYTLKDEEGQAAVISFPKDRTIGTFWLRGKRGQEVACRKTTDAAGKSITLEMPELVPAAGEHFERLFFPMFKPAKGFAELLPALLGSRPAKLRRLTEMCFEASSPRCTFKTHDANGAERAREQVLLEFPQKGNHRGTEGQRKAS